MAMVKLCFVILLVIFCLLSVSCLPEPGKKELKFNKEQAYGFFQKTMDKGYKVAVKGNCNGTTSKFHVEWYLLVAECAGWFESIKDHEKETVITSVLSSQMYKNHSLHGKGEVSCPRVHLPDASEQEEELIITPPSSDKVGEDDDNKKDAHTKGLEKKPDGKANKPKSTKTGTSTQREKRSQSNQVNAAKDAASEEGKPTGKPAKKSDKKEKKQAATEVSQKSDKKEKKLAAKEVSQKVENQICVTKRDGVFVLLVNVYPVAEESDFQLTLNVEMKGKHGYLSASDWPLYPFYGFMSLLYVSYGVVWLIVSACQWRDLLRIQFWIGGVIALGMLEKAVFFSQYNEMNISGIPNQSLTIFAELVSCVKRTLARILVIIVSMGFGIVKPRLGSTLHRVLGVGALYFVLAVMEGCFRSLHRKADPGKQQLIASIPLAILDASICWWIFMSLVQTTRTLRIRRNVVKLSLYRHFTNTLIFAVLASVAYMIWSIKTHRFAKDNCITDWSELWLDEAFWHFLFSLVLLVIMVLWRPTANNQRYAFTPIVDFGEDEEEDDNMTLSDAFDGMKMRNHVKNVPEVQINGDSKRKSKPEDDLKWVEENIPSSAADVVLPSVLDSDEELMTTKFEMSKME
ncbi:transmembrane protein 87A-like isoform X4 [Acropora muricata]|uniref:transmembrane protein 87A-like isoform X3 n=1 Tax=Acropora muricata TaxID=159855 RepID=UPI0034E4C292